MKHKTRIVIAGIGGVGGYFGGLLARYYENNHEVEIVFLARGDHLRQIQTSGLKVITGATQFTARPFLATDDPAETGIVDYIIVCTKSYDLQAIVEQLRPCIAKQTILLPLLNGVDCAERIRRILPGQTVLDGCVYVVSRLLEKGVVANLGNIQTLTFGLQNEVPPQLRLLERLLKDASIDATLTMNIEQVVWEKFIFISPTATATSWLDCDIGTLVRLHEPTILKLIDEVKQVAAAKGIQVDGGVAAKILNRLRSLPGETTSSMHSDIRNGKPRTEIDSLTYYVLEQGKMLGIPTPVYEMAYYDLTHRTEQQRSTV